MKTLDEFVKLQQSECRKNMGNLWRPIFDEWLELLLRETARATVEACRPVERGKYWNHDTITGQELTLEEFEQKAKAWLGEEK